VKTGWGTCRGALCYPLGMAAEAPVKQRTPVRSERPTRDVPWNVVVWNDPVTLMSYVVLVFRRLFGHDLETATTLMLQVHNEGKAVVATQPREQAEISVAKLHAFGLQATLARV
jgi:ATP-dependent Clp protease adaptor protein ClpS